MKLFPNFSLSSPVLLRLSLCCILLACASFAKAADEVQSLSFESGNMPSSGIDGNYETTSERWINGSRSLKWSFSSGSNLTIRHNFNRVSDSEARSKQSNGVQIISFWIYNENPINDSMRLQLQSGGGSNLGSSVPIRLNFKGWRAIGLALTRDMNISQSADIGRVRFTAPGSSGELYIDQIMVSLADNRYQWSDDQVTTRATSTYQYPRIDFGLPDNIPNATDEEIQATADIRKAFVEEYAESQNVSSLRSYYDSLNIERSGGVITGRHVITRPQRTRYQRNYLSGDARSRYDDYESDLERYTLRMLSIAQAYHDGTSGSRSELAQWYVDMTEHLLDQGFADGSALVTTHHWGYNSSGWYISALLMAPILEEKGLLDDVYKALLWFSREFYTSFNMELNERSSDVDYFATQSRQHLVLLLLNPDPNERVALMYKFSEFFTGALAQDPPGTMGGLKPDGTLWHHRSNYPWYGLRSTISSADVVYKLRNAPFAIGADGKNKLRMSLLAGWNYTNPELPIALSGRVPFNANVNQGRLAEPFYKLAHAYSPVDYPLASVHLAITGRPASDSTKLFGREIQPAPRPRGNWSYNGGTFMVHRHGTDLALVKGYDQIDWSAEIYETENRFGRYQSHGGVQIMPLGDPARFGFDENGWDWNRNPGTTSIYLSLGDLNPPDRYITVVSSEGTSASVSLGQRYGLFNFRHVAPSRSSFDSDFRANKTVYAAHGLLLMEGHSIRSRSNRTETQLFQHRITSETDRLVYNGSSITGSDRRVIRSGDWIIDGNNTGYYLHDVPSGELVWGSQSSRDHRDRSSTSGTFARAWLDHGSSPSNDSYRYLVVMNATPEVMNAVKTRFDDLYQVERYGDNLMVIDKATTTYGYVLYEPREFNQGPVVEVDGASQVLAQVKDNVLYLSASAPDLNIPPSGGGSSTKEYPPVPIQVTVAGTWVSMEEGDQRAQIQGDNTVVNLSSYFGISAQIQLKPQSSYDGRQLAAEVAAARPPESLAPLAPGLPQDPAEPWNARHKDSPIDPDRPNPPNPGPGPDPGPGPGEPGPGPGPDPGPGEPGTPIDPDKPNPEQPGTSSGKKGSGSGWLMLVLLPLLGWRHGRRRQQ